MDPPAEALDIETADSAEQASSGVSPDIAFAIVLLVAVPGIAGAIRLGGGD